MINGIVNVYKEKGFTSFDVVAKMRGIFHQKKIGHTGTLDPDAEGVLPVCLGSATKVCELLTDKDKEYEAVMLLGVTTDTQDVTGQVLQEKPVAVSEEAVKNTVLSFVGGYMQVPPMYSALKVGGKKLCDLARSGITVERAARPVVIHGIEIVSMELPRVRMRVSCSKGTYIRTLCQDIGETLGCGGCMESLLRTRVSEFVLKDAMRLKEIEARAGSGQMDFVRSVDSVFLQYLRVDAEASAQKLLDNGNRLSEVFVVSEEPAEDGRIYRLYDADAHFTGLYSYVADAGEYKPVKLFFDKG